MDNFSVLNALLEHLKGYGHGDRLKREAMQALQNTLDDLQLSRREFLRQAQAHGVAVPTITTLGNWISCKHWPRLENVDTLLEALELVLRDHGRLVPEREKLLESTHSHEYEIHRFQQESEDLEQAQAGLADTIAWIDLTEFPPAPDSLPSSFIPLNRRHGIERLQTIITTQNQHLEATNYPAAIPHSLLVATAATVLSHFLGEVAQHEQAVHMADEGFMHLEDVLQRSPSLGDENVTGYPWMSLSELALLSLLRRNNAMMALARHSKAGPQQRKWYQLATATLKAAAAQTRTLTRNQHNWQLAVESDLATLLIQQGGQTGCFTEAERLLKKSQRLRQNLDRPDDALHYYLANTKLALTLLPQGRLIEAGQVLADAEAAVAHARAHHLILPGPVHRLSFMQSRLAHLRALFEAEGRNGSRREEYLQAWHQQLTQAMNYARLNGLRSQELDLLNLISELRGDLLRPFLNPESGQREK